MAVPRPARVLVEGVPGDVGSTAVRCAFSNHHPAILAGETTPGTFVVTFKNMEGALSAANQSNPTVSGRGVKISLLLPDLHGCHVTVTSGHVEVNIGHEALSRLLRDTRYRDHFDLKLSHVGHGKVWWRQPAYIGVTRWASVDLHSWQLNVMLHLEELLVPYRQWLSAKTEEIQGDSISVLDTDHRVVVTPFTDVSKFKFHFFMEKKFVGRMLQACPGIEIGFNTVEHTLTLKGKWCDVQKALRYVSSCYNTLSRRRVRVPTALGRVWHEPFVQEYVQRLINQQSIVCQWKRVKRTIGELRQDSRKIMCVTALEVDYPRIEDTLQSCFVERHLEVSDDQISLLLTDTLKSVMREGLAHNDPRPKIYVSYLNSAVSIVDRPAHVEVARRAVINFLFRQLLNTSKLNTETVQEVVTDLKPCHLKMLGLPDIIRRLSEELGQAISLNTDKPALVIEAPIHQLDRCVNRTLKFLDTFSDQHVNLTAAAAEMYQQPAARKLVQSALDDKRLLCHWELEGERLVVSADTADHSDLEQTFLSFFAETRIPLSEGQASLLQSDDWQSFLLKLKEATIGHPTPVVHWTGSEDYIVCVDTQGNIDELCEQIRWWLSKIASPQRGYRESANQQPDFRESTNEQPGSCEFANQQLFSRESANQQPSSRESANQQPCSRESANQQPCSRESANQQPSSRESANQQPVSRESANQQPGSRESAYQQPGSRESANQQPGSRESANQQPGSRESAYQQPGSRESANQQPGSRESANQQSGSRVSANQQPGSRESANQQPGSRESANQQPGSRESANQQSGSRELANQQPGSRESANQQPGSRESSNQHTIPRQSANQNSFPKELDNRQPFPRESVNEQQSSMDSDNRQQQQPLPSKFPYHQPGSSDVSHHNVSYDVSLTKTLISKTVPITSILPDVSKQDVSSDVTLPNNLPCAPLPMAPSLMTSSDVSQQKLSSDETLMKRLGPSSGLTPLSLTASSAMNRQTESSHTCPANGSNWQSRLRQPVSEQAHDLSGFGMPLTDDDLDTPYITPVLPTQPLNSHDPIATLQHPTLASAMYDSFGDPLEMTSEGDKDDVEGTVQACHATTRGIPVDYHAVATQRPLLDSSEITSGEDSRDAAAVMGPSTAHARRGMSADDDQRRTDHGLRRRHRSPTQRVPTPFAIHRTNIRRRRWSAQDKADWSSDEMRTGTGVHPMEVTGVKTAQRSRASDNRFGLGCRGLSRFSETRSHTECRGLLRLPMSQRMQGTKIRTHSGCTPQLDKQTAQRIQERETSGRIQELETSARIQELETRGRIQELETSAQIQELETRGRIQELETSARIQELETSARIQELETRVQLDGCVPLLETVCPGQGSAVEAALQLQLNAAVHSRLTVLETLCLQRRQRDEDTRSRQPGRQTDDDTVGVRRTNQRQEDTWSGQPGRQTEDHTAGTRSMNPRQEECRLRQPGRDSEDETFGARRMNRDPAASQIQNRMDAMIQLLQDIVHQRRDEEEDDDVATLEIHNASDTGSLASPLVMQNVSDTGSLVSSLEIHNVSDTESTSTAPSSLPSEQDERHVPGTAACYTLM